ncbi:MAG: hypothetical protein ACRYFZ_09625 [Janthinobacterium lividum]
MSYYPTFNKLQDMGLELLNKEPGVPLAFGKNGRAGIVEVWAADKTGKKVRMWLGNQVVYSGYPDSEYDFNTLWEELVEPFIYAV